MQAAANVLTRHLVESLLKEHPSSNSINQFRQLGSNAAAPIMEEDVKRLFQRLPGHFVRLAAAKGQQKQHLGRVGLDILRVTLTSRCTI